MVKKTENQMIEVLASAGNSALKDMGNNWNQLMQWASREPVIFAFMAILCAVMTCLLIATVGHVVFGIGWKDKVKDPKVALKYAEYRGIGIMWSKILEELKYKYEGEIPLPVLNETLWKFRKQYPCFRYGRHKYCIV